MCIVYSLYMIGYRHAIFNKSVQTKHRNEYITSGVKWAKSCIIFFLFNASLMCSNSSSNIFVE